ncbi:DUF2997 domain-containing protein [[Phormidium] sp. ETS-05]|uniref:DUF2997 domain-containing protein n=1 Tax=[Phormidium] sp. ETS-05 TaxID=222819 RepID=UPI0018EEED60|nr:DUF2997 domain-containing protein [[Phormidium] sp. ETS-05]
MAEYQKIEYLISKDGKITERVIGATGASCIDTTAGMEKAIGSVVQRSLLPEYYSEEECLENQQQQSLEEN